MPYKDKTELKEAQHQWYVKNRDRVRHQARNFVRRRRFELRKKASLYKSERGCKAVARCIQLRWIFITEMAKAKKHAWLMRSRVGGVGSGC
jgi:hypothetical protein